MKTSYASGQKAVKDQIKDEDERQKERLKGYSEMSINYQDSYASG